MILGRTRKDRDGAPGRAGRLLAVAVSTVLVMALIGTIVVDAQARMNDSDRERYERVMQQLQSRIYVYYGWYHSVGQVLLHVSNLGFFGRFGGDLDNPSCEWPAGSNMEYLYAAGLWVGGVISDRVHGGVDTLVSAAVYQVEFRPDPESFNARIFESWEGTANSTRLVDDDGDCGDHVFDPDKPFEWYDEDPLDGIDNDGDGRIDEDFAAISQQMYRMEYEDTYEEDVNEGATIDLHRSLGLRVIQESYQWTSDRTDDFVGIEYKVINNGNDTIRMAYIGFMVDADAGPDDDDIFPYTDDRGGFIDTTIISQNPNPAAESEFDTLSITLAYMFDDPYGQDGNVAQGYLGCMFLGHPTIDADTLQPGNLPSAPTEVRLHAFRLWSSGAEDPRNDQDRYRFLKGRADFPLLDGLDNNGDGYVDDEDEWRVNIDRDSRNPQDWRFLLSAGPFRAIFPGDTLTFQYAFVMGQGLDGMLENAATAQQIYNGIRQDFPNCSGELEDSVLIHWVADTPPPPPNQEITTGDGFVRLEWDDYPEDLEDPLTRIKDFYGYQVWKAVGWTRESTAPRDQDWQLILDIDRSDGGADLDEYDTGLEGVGKYSFVDPLVKNGFAYWYSVTAYDSTREGYHFGKYTQNKTLVFPNSGVRNTLDDIIVVPNPYVNHEYIARWNLAPDETDPTGEKLCFHNLPRDSIVRIYSLGGELVRTLYPAAESTGGDACWNMISRNDQIIVSGVYLYHVDSPVGEKIGKFAIIK
jgi:hypothetical protein